MYASSHIAPIYAINDTAGILLNLLTGRRVFLNRIGCAFWRQLEEGRSVNEASLRLAERFNVPIDRLQSDMAGVIALLEMRGMLSREKSGVPLRGEAARFLEGQTYSNQTGIVMSERNDKVKWRYLLLAGVGLAVALLLLRLPFRYCMSLAVTCRRWCRRRASPELTYRLLVAVRKVAGLYWGRAACLETSLGVFVAGTIMGRPPVWCVGASFDPLYEHAWVEAEFNPVGEPSMQGKPFAAHLRI